jgi:hypothetical protein
MLIARRGFKMFYLLKMALLGKNFLKFLNFYYIKSTFWGEKREANGLCQVIYLLKKSTFHFMKLLIAIECKFENNASTSPNVKK